MGGDAGDGGLWLERDFVVFEGPFFHVADAERADAIDDQFWTFWGWKIASKEGVGVPDLADLQGVGKDLGDTGDADLIVSVVEVAEFDLGIIGELLSFGVAPEVSDVDGEVIDADG